MSRAETAGFARRLGEGNVAESKAARRTIAALCCARVVGGRALSALTGADVYVKYENLRSPIHSRNRGACVKTGGARGRGPRRGVIACRRQPREAVAYHARRLGIPATIVMPLPTPFVKVKRPRRWCNGRALRRDADQAQAARRGARGRAQSRLGSSL